MEHKIDRATGHLKDILRDAIQLAPTEKALVVFDTESDLTKIMTEAYRRALPNGRFVDFADVVPADVLGMIDALSPGDLVVLVQSMNFRLDEFRLRIELFKRSLKTIEHIHLSRMSEDQWDTYIESLAYDSNYYRPLGRRLASKLDTSHEIVVECAGTKLVYTGGMEQTKLNIGDYSTMKNIGGTFPIGEVFTEAKDLRSVNGEAMVFACAGNDHMIRLYRPFRVQINEGIFSSPEGPAEFREILDRIREDEEVLVREFGLGINAAMDKSHIVNDITAFERQKGLHLSLGAKHAMYVKPGLGRKKGRYHVDVFIDAERILIDSEVIYSAGSY
jgi:hypothetical protein